MRVKVTKLFYEPEANKESGWDCNELCEWIIGEEFEAEKLSETNNWDYLAFSDMLGEDIFKLYVIIFNDYQTEYISSFFGGILYPNEKMTFNYWPEDCLEILE